MADQSIQQRLAAVLAADVVGYTRLMEEDSEGTVSAWQSVRDGVINPVVSDHSGRIVKLTGDGFLAEFATIHEAVRCGIALQDGFAESSLEFRIGINLGDIIDDGQDIHGEGVNVAARIEALADPGGISISGGVHDQVRNRIEATYEDRGEQRVKNVSAPVRVYAIRLDGSTDAVSLADMAIADKPSIAVLPFDNLSGDPEQEYFADGISEDVITALSRFRQFFVIARNTTFTYKGQAVDIKAIAKDLGVRYVLEGSVRKAGNQVRITTQLIDGETGNHLWAEKYDRELEDVFEVQDDIVRTVIGAMAPEIDRAEQERASRKPPENLDAWELYHRGMVQLYKFNVEANVEARRLFEAAIERDSDFAGPHQGISRSYATDRFLGVKSDNAEVAIRIGKRAVELDDRDVSTHLSLGLAYWTVVQDNDAAIREFEDALRINPSDAQVLHGLGRSLMSLGRAEEAMPYMQEAVRLSPSDMVFGVFCSGLAFCHLFLQNYDQAVEWSQTAMQKLPPQNNLWLEMASLPAALAHLGKDDEARKACEELEAIRSDLSIELIRERTLIVHPEYLDRLSEGLRKAGLPET